MFPRDSEESSPTPQFKSINSSVVSLLNGPTLTSIHDYFHITVEIVSDFILGGSKITVDGDWSHKIKRCSLLGRKVMTNVDSVLKSRDITLLTNVHIVKVRFFQ